MSHVLGHLHATPATTRPSSPYSGIRWAIVGCAAFWSVVGVGIARAIGG